MRLWSIHPKYLDSKGLVALWREALLARKVLQGDTKGYRNHPQLNRFKESPKPSLYIDLYLYHVYLESKKRGYNFKQLDYASKEIEQPLSVTSGQISYEFNHLLKKLKVRDPQLYEKYKDIESIDPHPLFKVEDGYVAEWEIT